jgi:3-oxoacyl-[acyl-carrier protein] reductase
MKLDEAHVLITGGGRGIGRHLVNRLAGTAARVAVFERDAEACAALSAEFPDKVLVVPCDVTDVESVRSALQATYDAGFEPDVLVNNAGMIHSAPLVNMLSRQDRIHSVETWHQVIAANLHSVFYVTGQVVDRMISRRTKGLVISISSISANGNPGQSAYSAAKAGVNALTRTWAKELGAMGLRFVAIAPGFLDTPSTRAALSESIVARLQQQIPLRRLGDMESIFQSVHYAVENDYLTGTVLEVDGGLVI